MGGGRAEGGEVSPIVRYLRDGQGIRRAACRAGFRRNQYVPYELVEGRSLIRQRNAIEDRAVELLGERPDYLLLRTIPGIGPINALTILAETGDLRRFHHHRQFLKFCGMDLATVQSGMFRGRSKISNYGNARLRRTLWLAGQTAVLKKQTASGTSSNAPSRRTVTTPICAARPILPSPQRWRAPFTPS